MRTAALLHCAWGVSSVFLLNNACYFFRHSVAPFKAISWKRKSLLITYQHCEIYAKLCMCACVCACACRLCLVCRRHIPQAGAAQRGLAGAVQSLAVPSDRRPPALRLRLNGLCLCDRRALFTPCNVVPAVSSHTYTSNLLTRDV